MVQQVDCLHTHDLTFINRLNRVRFCIQEEDKVTMIANGIGKQFQLNTNPFCRGTPGSHSCNGSTHFQTTREGITQGIRSQKVSTLKRRIFFGDLSHV